MVGAIAAVIAFLLTREKKTQPAKNNNTATDTTTLQDTATYHGPELLSQYLLGNIPTNTGIVGPSLPPEPQPGQAWDHYTRVPDDEPAWWEIWK